MAVAVEPERRVAKRQRRKVVRRSVQTIQDHARGERGAWRHRLAPAAENPGQTTHVARGASERLAQQSAAALCSVIQPHLRLDGTWRIMVIGRDIYALMLRGSRTGQQDYTFEWFPR